MVIISNEILKGLGPIDTTRLREQMQFQIQILDANSIKELFKNHNIELKKILEDNRTRINQNGI